MTINVQMDESPKKKGRPPKAIKEGSDKGEELISRSEVDRIVAEELAKREKELRERARTPDQSLIATYKEKTRITDEEFIEKLIKWQIKVDIAEYLQNKDKDLSREKLWEYIRKEYKPKKKR